MSIKRILVPTDFSECAMRATDIAGTLARKLNSEIIFLHFFPDPDVVLHKRVKYEKNANEAAAELARTKSRLDLLVKNARREGTDAKGVLVYDKGNESIEDYAESYRADLIVMGTHGASGLTEWLGGGSNTQRVSRNSDIPLLAIKGNCQKLEIKNIIFASSFEENLIPAMFFITELAAIWDATIHLFYVNRAIHSVNQKSIEAKMQDVVDKFPEAKFTMNYGDTNDEELAIRQGATKLNADLVAITPHDRDGAVRFFSRTIAENLVNHEEHPVLVLPEG